MTPDRARAARDLLDFYAEAGVDALVAEAPGDRLATAHADAAPAADVAPVPQRQPLAHVQLSVSAAPLARPPVAPAPDVAVIAAREAARSAASLGELRTMLEKFEGCALRTTAKQLVFADGNPQSRVMFVGEAPGREEDLEGLPFVGRSGKLLDQMIAAIGLDRTSAYIANIIPWRPPGNRTPTPQESQICLPFIQRQIELVNPDILVCMGNPATQTLLGVKDGIKRTRGRWFNFHTGTREIRAIATFHPAYLLRSPLDKRLAWRDLLAIRTALDEPQA
ncbi:MAG: uracil-DNA glycosylase [Alphaproteobacteria bacterium]|nr:MAG: uracil-DNA glycosylase [Alphaproteobacteria bacterium]